MDKKDEWLLIEVTEGECPPRWQIVNPSGEVVANVFTSKRDAKLIQSALRMYKMVRRIIIGPPYLNRSSAYSEAASLVGYINKE